MKFFIDKDMKKEEHDLCTVVGFSCKSMVKLMKNENVTSGILLKICRSLNFDIGGIIKVISDSIDE